MIKLDGSKGEGGGQILRSALTLSALTGQPFEIHKIRAGRAKPGLLRQHFTALRAAAAICGGKYSDDAALGSTSLMFYPGDIRAGNYEFAVGTAGSATLVLQTILLPLLMADAPSRVIISGGTHNPAAPPFEFIERCFAPVLRDMGATLDLQLLQVGFMPAGGGKLMATIEPCDGLSRVDIPDRGEQMDLIAEAYFANLPVEVAQRELASVKDRLKLPEAALRLREVKSIGPGNMLAVTARFEHVTEVSTGFGRRGRRAEDVASALCDEFEAYLASQAAVGSHLADQILIPMALAGGGSFTTLQPSGHTRTNADVLAHFLDIDVAFEPLPNGGPDDVTVTITRTS